MTAPLTGNPWKSRCQNQGSTASCHLAQGIWKRLNEYCKHLSNIFKVEQLSWMSALLSVHFLLCQGEGACATCQWNSNGFISMTQAVCGEANMWCHDMYVIFFSLFAEQGCTCDRRRQNGLDASTTGVEMSSCTTTTSLQPNKCVYSLCPFINSFLCATFRFQYFSIGL